MKTKSEYCRRVNSQPCSSSCCLLAVLCLAGFSIPSVGAPVALDSELSIRNVDDQIPSPSELQFWPLIRLFRNNPCRTKLRFTSAMARRLQSRLKQSAIYAVALANSDKQEARRPASPESLRADAGRILFVFGTLLPRAEG